MFIGRPERRPMPLAFLAICLLLIAPTSHARADTPLDFLVQQVCDDGSGGHTSADPVTCPATARKLKIGESLPYHKWDIGGGHGASSYTCLNASLAAEMTGARDAPPCRPSGESVSQRELTCPVVELRPRTHRGVRGRAGSDRQTAGDAQQPMSARWKHRHLGLLRGHRRYG